MAHRSLSRKQFLKASSLALAGAGLQGPASAKPATAGHEKNKPDKPAVLRYKNVLLETGFEWAEGEVTGTQTELFTIEIENGHFKKIIPGSTSAPAVDGSGKLLLPMFRDMHIHLDKTFYGDKWQAVKKRTGGVKGMIALEQKILPGMLKTSTARAEKLIDLLQKKGTGFARSHVNIEPVSGLQSLKNLQQALDKKRGGFGAELVAFPQHGLFYTNSTGLMKEAAQMDIDYIGGLDPYSIDGDIERSIDFIVQLALDYNKGIDIHLHESGESGLQTVEHLIKRVNENPVLQHKTFISHCFVLGKLPPIQQEAVAEKLGAAAIGIMSTIPFGNLVMPIPVLYKHNVKVGTGNDSIIDHWNTWGTGSVLDKAKLMAQLYGYTTEFQLSRSLKLATYNLLPLDDTGKRQWPDTGDAADFVLVDASCSAEAVSRVSPVHSLVYNGNIVY